MGAQVLTSHYNIMLSLCIRLLRLPAKQPRRSQNRRKSLEKQMFIKQFQKLAPMSNVHAQRRSCTCHVAPPILGVALPYLEMKGGGSWRDCMMMMQQ